MLYLSIIRGFFDLFFSFFDHKIIEQYQSTIHVKKLKERSTHLLYGQNPLQPYKGACFSLFPLIITLGIHSSQLAF